MTESLAASWTKSLAGDTPGAVNVVSLASRLVAALAAEPDGGARRLPGCAPP